MRKFLRSTAALAGLTLALAACAQAGLQPVTTTTSTGKTVVSAAAVGTDAIQIGNVANLAAALYQTQAGASQTLTANLQKGAAALIAAGNSLKTSGATSGDLAANVQLISASLASMEAAFSTVSPATAAKIDGYVDAFNAALALYNTDAAAFGLPIIPVPTLVSGLSVGPALRSGQAFALQAGGVVFARRDASPAPGRSDRSVHLAGR